MLSVRMNKKLVLVSVIMYAHSTGEHNKGKNSSMLHTNGRAIHGREGDTEIKLKDTIRWRIAEDETDFSLSPFWDFIATLSRNIGVVCEVGRKGEGEIGERERTESIREMVRGKGESS